MPLYHRQSVLTVALAMDFVRTQVGVSATGVGILSQLGQDPTALFARARKGPRGPLSRPLPTRRIRRWNAQMRALVTAALGNVIVF